MIQIFYAPIDINYSTLYLIKLDDVLGLLAAVLFDWLLGPPMDGLLVACGITPRGNF